MRLVMSSDYSGLSRQACVVLCFDAQTIISAQMILSLWLIHQINISINWLVGSVYKSLYAIVNIATRYRQDSEGRYTSYYTIGKYSTPGFYLYKQG